MIDTWTIRFDAAGLVPGVVQDSATRTVLMVGYLNKESIEATITTGQVHFWSRSRDELWRKGATSGNTLELVDISADCDSDTLLITATPAGPICHTGQSTCFADGSLGAGFAGLESLWATIADRVATRPDGSYTVELIDGGVDAVGRKVLEEAGEVLVAAKNHAAGTDDDQRVAEEAADVLYHLLVLLAERGIDASRMIDELARRA